MLPIITDTTTRSFLRFSLFINVILPDYYLVHNYTLYNFDLGKKTDNLD